MKFRLFENNEETDQFMDIEVGSGPLQKLGEIMSLNKNTEGFVFFKDNDEGGRDMCCGVVDTMTNEVIKCFKLSNIYPTAIIRPDDNIYGQQDLTFNANVYSNPEIAKIFEDFKNRFQISTNHTNIPDEFKKDTPELSRTSPIKEMLDEWRRGILEND